MTGKGTVYNNYRWVVEWHTPNSALISTVTNVLYTGRTKYQDVEIAINEDMGKMLILDGKLQSAERDEFIYHEMLVHPALITHGNPESVLVIGGGEGGTLREILRYGSVKEVVMVDIDGEVVEACKRYLPEVHRGSFDDPRARMVIADGRKFVEETGKKFDAIVVDVTDPTEDGPSRFLYTIEFYRAAASKLTEGGVLVTQATSTFYNLDAFSLIVNTMDKVFPHVRGYQASIPSFISDWGFSLGSMAMDPAGISGDEASTRARRLGIGGLRYYEVRRHPHYFWLPPYVREALDDETGISMDESPAAIF